MNVGQVYSLRWQFPHRVEATVTELRESSLIAEVVHRCPATCELLQMRATLPIEGKQTYLYHEFAKLFEPMAEDALALPPAQP